MGERTRNGSTSYAEDAVVIIDNGSGLTKCGIHTEEEPTSVFPTSIGIPRKKFKETLEEFYCGPNIAPLRNKLTTHFPLENGIIQNFEHMEMLWEYIIDDVLNIDVMQHPMLLTEPPYNPKNTREKITEIMFETFAVPELNLSVQGVLALLGQGRTTGLVLDSGDGVSHTIPVYEGFGLPNCIQRMDLGGRDLNVFLAKLIAADQHISLSTSSDQDYVRQMKETYCYVSKFPTHERVEEKDFQLPDGRLVKLGEERWKVPEALFQPHLVGMEMGNGLAGLVWDTIQRCDMDVRSTMLSNVILSGGSTLFPNFSDRLVTELHRFAPVSIHSKIKVISPQKRDLAVYSGAILYAGLKHMQPENWMSADEYEEYGASLIHEKQLLKYN